MSELAGSPKLPGQAQRLSVIAILFCACLVGAGALSHSTDWRYPGWLNELFTILIWLAVGAISLASYFSYRSSKEYRLLIVGSGFLALFCLYAFKLLGTSPALAGWIDTSLPELQDWSTLMVRSMLASVLVSGMLLIKREQRLGSGGKLIVRVLLNSALLFSVLNITFLYLMVSPLMDKVTTAFFQLVDISVSLVFICGVLLFSWRHRWERGGVDYALMLMLLGNTIVHIWILPVSRFSEGMSTLLAGVVELLCYLLLLKQVLVAGQSLHRRSQASRHDERLTRLVDAARERKLTMAERFQLKISAKIALLAVCLSVVGIGVTYTIFYASFVEALEKEKFVELDLRSHIQQVRLQNRFDGLYLQVQQFSQIPPFELFQEQQYVSGEYLPVERAYWQERLGNSLHTLLARNPSFAAGHLYVIDEGLVQPYVRKVSSHLSQGPLTSPSQELLNRAWRSPLRTQAQVIRGSESHQWQVAQAVVDSMGQPNLILLIYVSLPDVLGSIDPIYPIEDGMQAELPNSIYDKNGNLLWSTDFDGSQGLLSVFQNYSRLKGLLDSPIQDVDEQVIKVGYHLYSIQRFAYLPGMPGEYLELVQVEDHRKALAATRSASSQALWAVIAVVALVIFVGWFFAHTIVGPVRYLSNATLLFGERNIKVNLPTNASDEVGVLAKAIDTMREQVSARTEELQQEVVQRQRSERELKSARQRAEQASVAKSEFMAVMSHEIRTPMNGILGMSQLLSSTHLEPSQRDYLETIESSSKALMGILNDMLDFSKIEAGKLELERAPFNLYNAISDVVHLYSHHAQVKNIRVNVDYAEDKPRWYWGDLGRVRQIILNLVSNAVKFTLQGEVRIKATRYSNTVGEHLLCIEVSDTGIGIEKEAQKQLFVPFTQADSSTTRRFGGTGLGLAISQQLVSLMGGRIELESAPQQGSTFSILLPLDALTEEEIEGLQQTQAEVGELGDSFPPIAGRVLLVEDTMVNQRVAGLMLDSFGLDVVLANNGLEAIERYKEWKDDISLILMDCLMPELDGYQATMRIRRMEKDVRRVPIVALTANAHRGAYQACLDAGMDDFLSKPIDREALYRVLRHWIVTMDKKTKPDMDVDELNERIENQVAAAQAKSIEKEAKSLEQQAQLSPESAVSEPPREQVASSAAGAALQHVELEVYQEMRESIGEDFGLILEQYFEETDEMIAQLHSAIEQQNQPEVQRLAHSIKSSSAYFGGHVVHDHAKQLEGLAKQQSDAESLMPLAAKLKQVYQLTRDEMAQLQQRESV
ncbi:ATP-binding protein [Aliagarivorans taiwanensis]|uniref:ATP-binding protein n=1 Tax=Aliagarivorans taiwanensis TaxID=561966 RepID=UPI0003FA61F2|nr:ATP-binding protein [Aliagarivorans taiwanensis]